MCKVRGQARGGETGKKGEIAFPMNKMLFQQCFSLSCCKISDPGGKVREKDKERERQLVQTV